MKVLPTNAFWALIVVAAFAAYLPFASVRLFDFRSFYCAGKAVAMHADPYREHPLHECERATFAPGMSRQIDDVTVPAPLPGYVLALFSALASLPFGICALVWIAASLVASIATVELLRRVFDVALPQIAVAVILPAAIVALPLGQSAPFVGCAIALCAYGLQYGRWRLAAVGALATSFDPAVALVLCATLLFAVPRTRVTILVGTAALVGLSLVALGVEANVEYVRRVLAAHAAANVTERSQFSATHFAWVAGVSRDAALRLGSYWYGCAALLGIALALRLRFKFGIAALAFVPPAFAVFGGVYVHYSQLALAIPAFLMTLQRSSHRWWLFTAVFVLAIPWLPLAAFPPFSIALVVIGAFYARKVHDVNFGLRLGLGSAALLLALFAAALLTIHGSAPAFHTKVPQDALSEVAWSRYVAWRDAKPDRTIVLLQMPTVIAFVCCLGFLVRCSVTGNRTVLSLVPHSTSGGASLPDQR